jgi:hypothetical protein
MWMKPHHHSNHQTAIAYSPKITTLRSHIHRKSQHCDRIFTENHNIAIAYSPKIKIMRSHHQSNHQAAIAYSQKTKQCDRHISRVVQQSLAYYIGIVEIPLYCFHISFLIPLAILTFFVSPTLVVIKILNVLIL